MTHRSFLLVKLFFGRFDEELVGCLEASGIRRTGDVMHDNPTSTEHRQQSDRKQAEDSIGVA